MSDPIALVIDNRNYSSWSVRAWLAMNHSGLAFEEIFIPLDLPDTKAAIAKHSPSGLVPVLKVGDNIVWESMAIIETLAELAPDMKFWPEDFAALAMARSVSAQMHAPVVGRLRTFGVPTNDICESYMDAVLAHPDMAAWMDGAKAEPYVIGNP